VSWATGLEPAGEDPASADKVLRSVGRRNRTTLVASCIEALTEAIQKGIYPPRGRLPSEEELAEQLDVSRATVREALRALEDRRFIVRKHGRGTFVSDRSIEKDLSRNFGITTMIRAAGYRPSTRDISVGTVRARPELASKLALQPGAEVVTVRRVRLADGRPVVHSTESIARELIEPEELEALEGEHQSLYGILYKLRGIVIYRGSAQLEAVAATRQLAECFGISRGTPLLCIHQVDFDEVGRPVLYSIEHHVSDWVRFTVERLGPGRSVDE
jgi:GntR family transcriptional regulator